MKKKNILYILLCTTIIALPTTAMAHITLVDKHAVSGSTIKNALQIGHGCTTDDGRKLSTRKVIMSIPDGVKQARPFAKAGWTIKTVIGPITPYESRGNLITEDVVEIIWRANGKKNKLDYNFRDEFTFRATMPSKPAQSIYFPATQVCNNTNKVEWIGIPVGDEEPGDLDRPAPRLVTTPSGL